jgi:hypothetical protein
VAVVDELAVQRPRLRVVREEIVREALRPIDVVGVDRRPGDGGCGGERPVRELRILERRDAREEDLFLREPLLRERPPRVVARRGSPRARGGLKSAGSSADAFFSSSSASGSTLIFPPVIIRAIVPYCDSTFAPALTTAGLVDARRSAVAACASGPAACAGSAPIGRPLLLIIVMPAAAIA